ncbi:MAG: autotransporter domain-containing protein [Alphaproteobacteria bacterium]|nr:autotransporter domain-containing protein [Alphaproteobacteria bacterium]
MLRLSRNGIGVLTSQYRSILKKCAWLNLMAAGVFMFAANAMAENATGADLTAMANGIKSPIYDSGTGSYTSYHEPYAAYIYSGASTLTEEMFSDSTHQTGWINNYGTVAFGKNESGTAVSNTVVSGKHNLYGGGSDVTQSQGGGVIGNLNNNTLNSSSGRPFIGATLDILGTTFNNNSATDFTKVTADSKVQAVGGVLANVSVGKQSGGANNIVSVKDSSFTSNYTMQYVNAFGGAIYNGWDEDVVNLYGDDGGQLVSENNTFIGNHVGNEYFSSTGLVYTNIWEKLNQSSVCGTGDSCGGNGRDIINSGTSRAYAITDHALGGAVYNIGKYTSSDDTYRNNYATGKIAQGGAIYHSDYNIYDQSNNIYYSGAAFTLEGEVNFDANRALSNTPTTQSGYAQGGAIYNMANMNIVDGSVLNFTNNYVNSIAGKYADGGAIYNGYGSVVGISRERRGVLNVLQNATFSGNYATATAGAARGGAIYNAGRMIIADATFSENYTDAPKSGAASNSHGGAIYNASGNQSGYNGGYLLFDNRNTNSEIVFNSNKATNGAGGGIYNSGGTIYGEIAQAMRFSNNEDSETVTVADNTLFGKQTVETHGGGAIYNGANATLSGAIRFNLIDDGQIVFAKHGYDNVYNLEGQLVQFNGSNNASRAMQDMGRTKAAELSEVTTFATFLGKGNYEFINTQLNLDSANGNGSGYISLDPLMKMAYNEVTLSSTGPEFAHMYVSSDDMLIHNDFYLEQNTILRYNDLDDSWDNAYEFDFSKTMTGLTLDSGEQLKFSDNGFGTASAGAVSAIDRATGTSSNKFYLGYYVENDGHIIYDDSVAQDSDVGIARHLVNTSNGVVRSEFDGYITKNIHIGTLENEGGKIYINMNNSELIRTDTEHKLIPVDSIPDGYAFGYYEGAHYNSEVITIDKAVSGETIAVFYTEANIEDNENPTRYSQINLDVGQRIYFAQTPGENEINLEEYSFSAQNGVNPDYTIKVGYDYNDANNVYDWFLYRVTKVDPIDPDDPTPDDGLSPDVMAALDLPRSAIEQIRSLRLPLDRTNRGQCNCYSDECDNRFCKYEDGSFRTRLWATPFYRSGTFDKPFETDFDLFGVDFGIDFQPTTKDEVGVFGSYRNGKYENDGNKKHRGEKGKYFSYLGSEIKLQSWLAGGYYRRYVGDLYLMGALYGGKLDADLKGKNGVKNSVDGVTVGVQGEIGYDVRMTRRSILTPSFKATYNYIDFDNAKNKDAENKEIEFSKVHDVELEAALKLEYQFNNEHQLPTTGYIKPSIIQVLASGGEIKVDGREFKDTLDNETYGRIEVGADAELMRGFSLGVFGNYTGGSNYDAWGVGGNVRMVW